MKNTFLLLFCITCSQAFCQLKISEIPIDKIVKKTFTSTTNIEFSKYITVRLGDTNDTTFLFKIQANQSRYKESDKVALALLNGEELENAIRGLDIIPKNFQYNTSEKNIRFHLEINENFSVEFSQTDKDYDTTYILKDRGIREFFYVDENHIYKLRDALQKGLSIFKK